MCWKHGEQEKELKEFEEREPGARIQESGGAGSGARLVGRKLGAPLMLLPLDMNRAGFEPRRGIYDGLNVCPKRKAFIVRTFDGTHHAGRLKTGADEQ